MILGIIPARGGSKGIPRKNLCLLHGKPLVVWSIESAKKSKLLDRFFVSTDDDEIADVSRKAGAKVILRPEELAGDDTTTLEVMEYHLKHIDADTVVLLQPTSPIRGRVIDTAIQRFKSVGCDTLATGYMSTHVAWDVMEHGPRQKQKTYFHDDGCVYIFDSKVIKSGRWIGDKPHMMIIPTICNTEIDTLTDFWAVEGILWNILSRGVDGR